MSNDFDAYFKWFGIPPAEQPPNHYRLLGIPLFVEDGDVIEHAAEQRMMLLHSMQAGKHSIESQRLLDELARAKLCLLTSEEKTRYDDALRQTIARANVIQAPPPPTRSSAPPAPEVPPSSSGQAFTPIRTQPSHSSEITGTPTPKSPPPAETSFWDKASQAVHDLGLMASEAAQHTTWNVEKTKLENVDLPRAYAELGRDMVLAGRFQDDFAELYREIQILTARWREIEQQGDEPESLTEMARAAAQRVRGMVSTHNILRELDSAHARLGQAAFERYGGSSGSAQLTARIAACLNRRADLQRKLNAHD